MMDETIARDEDVKYYKLGYDGLKKGPARTNNMKTYVNLISVLLGKVSLQKLYSSFSNPPAGVAPITNKDAKEAFQELKIKNIMKTNRVRDMRVEREVARFMDEHLYCQPTFTRHDRTDDKNEQLKGSDIILSIPSKGIKDAIVDEKAMCNYYNKPGSLPTFSLELSFYRNDTQRVEGWLTDTKKATEYYMFIWLNATKEDFKAEDITWLECALVSRQKILDYLSDKWNLSIEHLRVDDDFIRAHYTEKGPIGKKPNSKHWFYYSPQLGERPINIVVKKEIYLELADIHAEFGSYEKSERQGY